jgi:uncharacterized protein YhjY with autotransporter beta-barrel domain
MALTCPSLFTSARAAIALSLLLLAAQGAMAQFLPPGTTIRVLQPDGLVIDSQGIVTGGTIEVRDSRGQGLAGVALTRRRINSAGVEQGSASGLATNASGIMSQGTLTWGTSASDLEGGANRYCLDNVPAAEATQACVDVTVLGTVITTVRGRKAYAVGGTDLAAASVAAAAQANAATSLQGVRLQLDHAQTRMRMLRMGTHARWVNDTTVQVNGRTLPVASAGGGGGGGGSSGGDAEQVHDAGWGGYVMGTVAVEEAKDGSELKMRTRGVSIGADYRLSRRAVAGASLGLSRSTTDVAGLADAQRARGSSLTVYGSYEPAPRWYLDGALSWGRNRFELQRTTPTGGVARADTDGTAGGLGLTAGYQFLGQRTVVSPYLRAELLRVNVDGYTESGDTPFSLGEQRVNANALIAGSEFQLVLPSRMAIWVPHARLEWQHQSQRNRDQLSATLVGTGLQVAIDPQAAADKSFGHLSLGLSAQFKRGVALFIDYETLFANDDVSERRLNFGAKLEF